MGNPAYDVTWCDMATLSAPDRLRQGICDGIINGPLIALMDDSCPAGRRSDVESMNASVGGEAELDGTHKTHHSVSGTKAH